LTISEKVDLFKELDNGVSQRVLAEKFNISRKQNYNLVRNREEVFVATGSEGCDSRKRLNVRISNSAVDDGVWRWFKVARSANIPVSGPLLQEKTLQFATALKLNDFKASNGWLQKFKERHNISGGKICGEAATVNTDIVNDWTSRLPELVS
jgi:hypothetical protein